MVWVYEQYEHLYKAVCNSVTLGHKTLHMGKASQVHRNPELNRLKRRIQHRALSVKGCMKTIVGSKSVPFSSSWNELSLCKTSGKCFHLEM
ncbi:hypothetical protein M8J76_003679 [Diaphorina citri]|nr:hypothetical protein M8J76_003679 [Diaphorina citri]